MYRMYRNGQYRGASFLLSPPVRVENLSVTPGLLVLVQAVISNWTLSKKTGT